jgi:hypothetical protein
MDIHVGQCKHSKLVASRPIINLVQSDMWSAGNLPCSPLANGGGFFSQFFTPTFQLIHEAQNSLDNTRCMFERGVHVYGAMQVSAGTSTVYAWHVCHLKKVLQHQAWRHLLGKTFAIYRSCQKLSWDAISMCKKPNHYIALKWMDFVHSLWNTCTSLKFVFLYYLTWQ